MPDKRNYAAIVFVTEPMATSCPPRDPEQDSVLWNGHTYRARFAHPEDADTRPAPTSEKPCCADFKAAMEDGTDNEGYGPLVSIADGETPAIGCGPPPINFCPWCGLSWKHLRG